MSTSDNSISLAVELAIHLLPAFTGSHDFDEIFEIAGDLSDLDNVYDNLGIDGASDDQAEPKRLMAYLLFVAARGADMDLDAYKSLVLRRMARDAENRR